MTPGVARRHVLQFLLSSPLLAGVESALWAAGQPSDPVITAADQALEVLDFELAARDALPPAHFGFLETGVDADATLKANRAGFDRFSLRMRRLVDVRAVDMSVSLLGTTWDTPIVLAPVSSQRAFHADAELAVARAARARNHLQILSTVSSTSVEDVTAARGAPVWYQLYPTDQWPITQALVKRAERAGCTALVLTVDLQGGSNRITGARARRADTRDCSACHVGDPLKFVNFIPTKPMFRGLDVSKVGALIPPGMTWDFVKQLRDVWSRPLVVKGLVTREDADLAVARGVDAIVVSNHGGRAEESGRATIESLVEVVEGTKGRVPVLVDGGFRRGTDVFKALALGATAVCIGRPYAWGLAAFGQAGVDRVLDILRAELLTVMRQAGTRRLGEIDRSFVIDSRPG